MKPSPVLLALVAPALGAAAPQLDFVPVEPRFAPAADEYRRIWQEEGPRIVAALERAAGIDFPEAPIEAIVGDTPPMTAYDGRSMRLRARYSPTYKTATLIHELGHRLSFLLARGAELDDHRLLYLFLYDAWADLYGADYADRMVAIERRIGRGYAEAWDWALGMNRSQRQARLRTLRVRLDYQPLDLGG